MKKKYVFEIDTDNFPSWDQTYYILVSMDEAKELIQCKDCKFFESRSVYGHGLCDVHCNGAGESEVVNETYFCYMAER